MNDLVSIIIPTFNSEKFIRACMESVQNQSYQNWEMILVDDASTDATVDLIAKLSESDNRIHWHQLKVNSGTGVARNLALSHAKGRYIAFLDADDLWMPQKLEKQIDFLNNNQIPFTFSSYDCMDEEGRPLLKRVVPPQNMTYKQLFFCNYVGNLTAIYDSHFFGKISISSIRKRQDWMLWLTVLKKIKKAQAVPESLAYYRVRDNSISASKISLVQHNFAVYRKYHGFNWIVSVGCMAVFLFTQLIIKPHYIKQLPS